MMKESFARRVTPLVLSQFFGVFMKSADAPDVFEVVPLEDAVVAPVEFQRIRPAHRQRCAVAQFYHPNVIHNRISHP